jgi:hypothetical protein
VKPKSVHYHFFALERPSPDTPGPRRRGKEQLTHCRWRSPSLALSLVTELGRPALPGPGRAVAVGAGPGLAPAHPVVVPADQAWCQGAASVLPLLGTVRD